MLCEEPFIKPWWGNLREEIPNTRYAEKIFERAFKLERLLVESASRPLDLALSEHQRALRMGKNDRNLLGTALYSAARNREALISSVGVNYEAGLLLKIGFLDALGSVNSEILGTFSNPDELLEILDEVRGKREVWLQKIYDEWEESIALCSSETIDALCSLFSIPKVFIEAGPWRSLYEAAKELARGKERQALHLRVKRDEDLSKKGIEELSRAGIDIKFSTYTTYCLIIDNPKNIRGLQTFRNGVIEIQDEGSQLLVEAASSFIKGKVLDLCAGGGGKALAMSDIAPEADIYAFDIDLRRLNGIHPRIRRGGIKNIKTLGSLDEVSANAPYDFVLIDAPCTSTGTIRRNPDIAWRWDAESVEQIVNTQRDLLCNSVSLVKRGGVLAYATCSLLSVENNLQFESFLKEYEDVFEEVVLKPTSANPFAEKENRLSFGARLPLDLGEYNGDSFYLAIARRR
ncbi:MAG: hypothetical protein C0608_02685 [Deltaproteobacteria bacterium]|nr:MAG: hypothetical protein C0608_02685 [Deltaproteobacteria bacterium]